MKKHPLRLTPAPRMLTPDAYDKAVTPIVPQGDYLLVRNELNLLDCDDLRDYAQNAFLSAGAERIPVMGA